MNVKNDSGKGTTLPTETLSPKWLSCTALICLVFVFPSVCLGVPYFSRTTASAYGYNHLEGLAITSGENDQGPAISEATAQSFGNASGSSRAMADPGAGILKVETFGNYSITVPAPLSWEVCFNESCSTTTPESLHVSGASSYTRSIWRVESNVLPPGSPVDLTLSLSLSGVFYGDPAQEGTSSAKIQAWLNLPETLLPYGGNPFDDTGYLFIPAWYKDHGVNPNLEISASNGSGPGLFDKTIATDAPVIGPGGLPIFFPPLPEVTVGDVVVLETYLQSNTHVLNDGDDPEIICSSGPCPPELGADFFHTGTSILTVTTADAFLSPVPLPSSISLLILGLGTILYTRKRSAAT